MDSLVIIEQYDNKIAEIQTIDQAMDGHSEIEAIKTYLREHGAQLNIQNKAAMYSIFIEQKGGEFLKAIDRIEPKKRPTNKYAQPAHISDGYLARLQEIGMSRRTAERWQSTTDIPQHFVRGYFAKCTEKGKAGTRGGLISDWRHEIFQSAIKSRKIEGSDKGRIYRMDGIEFLAGLEDQSVDTILTDPPYTTDIKGDISDFVNFWLPLAMSKVKSSGRLYCFFGAYPEEIAAYSTAAVQYEGDNLINPQILTWQFDNTIGPSPLRAYKNNTQMILYMHGPEAKPLNWVFRDLNNGQGYLAEQMTGHRINAPDGRNEGRLHSWQKPLELAERFLYHSTEDGMTVFDPFAGTGTFVLAGAKLNRIATGCEIDSAMIKICQERGLSICEG